MTRPLDRSRNPIQRDPLKHSISRAPEERRAKSVTVCIACLCNWTYRSNDIGKAAIIASDRQLIVGDVKYEPPQLKISFLTKQAILLVAGDLALYTEAIHKLSRKLLSSPEKHPATIAELYAAEMRSINFGYAANQFLSPLGLDKSIFSNQQKLPESLILSLASQLQNYRGASVEAILVGTDGKDVHLYLIDSDTNVSCHNDVGFVSIGIGAWHANSQLMQARFVNKLPFNYTLGLVYAAKKRGEIASSIGVETDMFIVNRNGWMPVAPEIMKTLTKHYEEYIKEQEKLASATLDKLNLDLQEFEKSILPNRQTSY